MRTNRTYWQAWPDNMAPGQHFDRKAAATAYCKRNGGGLIRKFKQLSLTVSESREDPIVVPAVKRNGR